MHNLKIYRPHNLIKLLVIHLHLFERFKKLSISSILVSFYKILLTCVQLMFEIIQVIYLCK